MGRGFLFTFKNRGQEYVKWALFGSFRHVFCLSFLMIKLFSGKEVMIDLLNLLNG